MGVGGGGSEAVWKFSENSSNLLQVVIPIHHYHHHDWLEEIMSEQISAKCGAPSVPTTKPPSIIISITICRLPNLTDSYFIFWYLYLSVNQTVATL